MSYCFYARTLGGIIAAFLALGAVAQTEPPPTADSQEAQTVRATVSLVHDSHYLVERLRRADGQASLHQRTHEAFIRQLDPRADLLNDQDLAHLGPEAVGAALESGNLRAVHALAARQRGRLAQRAAWVEGAVDDAPDASTATEHSQDHHAWAQRLRLELTWLMSQGRTRPQANAVVVGRYQALAQRAAARSEADELELFLDAYLAALDPHSDFRPPRRPVSGPRRVPRDLFGIGATLAFDGDYVQLQRLLGGGAAERSGLLNAGDRILTVSDGAPSDLPTDVVGWAIEEVADLIRGPRGTDVTLQVLPRGAQESSLPARVRLTRDRIVLDRSRVTSELVTVEGVAVGVIHVPAFYVDYAAQGRGDPNYLSAAADVTKALVRLRRDAPALGAILLDLRGNGGGALTEAVRMVGLFIDEGPVVRVRHANGGMEVFDDDRPGRAWDGPLAVLVDRYAASASEIVAAALQDYKRATVIGEATYGKGSVQQPFDLRDARDFPRAAGRISLTTAEFFRVNGESTQLNGVLPDLSLPASLTNGRYGERFELWPLAADRVPPSTYRAEASATMPLPSTDGLDSVTLWYERPAYLRGADENTGGAASTPLARTERTAFRKRLLERLGTSAVDPNAPLPILWDTLVRQDALHLLRQLAHTVEGPIAHRDAAPAH